VSLLRRPPKVEKLKRKGKWERLTAALSYEDLITDREGNLHDLGIGVREAAATALAEADAREATDGLLRALEDPEERVRVAAVRGLGKRDEPRATEALLSAVTSWTGPEQADARGEALDGLTRLDDPEIPRQAAELMLARSEELDDADGEVMKRLAEAGGRAARRATIDDLVRRLRRVSGTSLRVSTLLTWLGPDAVDALIEVLDDENAQHGAVLALGSIHDPRALDPLIALLRGSENPGVRRAAAWALGEIRDPVAADALLLATRDKDYEVRTMAGASFDNLGNVAVAVVMSGLVRSAIENGKREEPPSPVEATPPQPEVESPAAPGVPEAPAAQPVALTRTGAMLRRLLVRGEDPPRRRNGPPS
jgi:HEAT repeat protein